MLYERDNMRQFHCQCLLLTTLQLYPDSSIHSKFNSWISVQLNRKHDSMFRHWKINE